MRAPKENQTVSSWMDGVGMRKYNWRCLNKKYKAEIKSLLYQTFRFFCVFFVFFTAVQTQVGSAMRKGALQMTQKQSNYQHL